MKITISGPAASGKGTISRRFATEAGIGYVDLGLLFRLGVFALSSGAVLSLEAIPELIQNKDVCYLWADGGATITWYGKNITHLLFGQMVARQTSILAASPAEQKVLTVVANLVLGGFEDVICDGRNAGTTILPNADYKFFVTARLEERARRRYVDVLIRGESAIYQDIFREIEERDKRDSERIAHPLVIPAGTVILETDTRSVEESVKFIWDIIKIKT